MRHASLKIICRAFQLAAILCAIGITLSHPAAAHPLVLTVTGNAGNLAGTSGYMDLQFNPGALPGTQFATAAADEGDNPWSSGSFVLNGDVFLSTVSLTCTFDNASSYNDAFGSVFFSSWPGAFN